jgi:hypothetical protein
VEPSKASSFAVAQSKRYLIGPFDFISNITGEWNMHGIGAH